MPLTSGPAEKRADSGDGIAVETVKIPLPIRHLVVTALRECQDRSFIWVREVIYQILDYPVIKPGVVGLPSGSGEVDGGFGFDDEEGVGVGAPGGAEFLAGFVEGVGQDGKDDLALGAADEIETAFLLHELGLGRHSTRARLGTHMTPRKADPSSRCKRRNARSG